MCDLIPLIIHKEHEQTKEEISGQQLSVIFDGTSRMGEALVIVVRFLDKGWQIQQCLLHLQLISKSMSGDEVARELITVLSTQFGVGPSLLGAMRDRVSVNGAAMRTLKVVYLNVLDVGCFSHTIDNMGQHFCTPTLDRFMSAWLSMFSHSPKACLAWKSRTEREMASYSEIRWWSKWEVIHQVLVQFKDVQAFLEKNTDTAPANNNKLLSILQNP